MEEFSGRSVDRMAARKKLPPNSEINKHGFVLVNLNAEEVEKMLTNMEKDLSKSVSLIQRVTQKWLTKLSNLKPKPPTSATKELKDVFRATESLYKITTSPSPSKKDYERVPVLLGLFTTVSSARILNFFYGPQIFSSFQRELSTLQEAFHYLTDRKKKPSEYPKKLKVSIDCWQRFLA